MKKITAQHILTAVLALALVGVLVVGQVVTAADGEGANVLAQGRFEAYELDRQDTQYRTGLTGTDVITDLSTLPGSITPFALTNAGRQGARQNLSVSVRFSVSGANCTMFIAYYYHDGTTFNLMGVDQPQIGGAPTTVSATLAQDGNGDFASLTQVFDGYGATHAIVIITAVSAGNVDLNVGSF